MNLNESEVYTSEEAQKLLKISDSTFRRLVKKGVLRAAKIGGQYRVLGGEILRILHPTFPQKVKVVYKKVLEKLEK
ncbi:MAG: helix-turn-helix domain-containing protein [Candidatus Margulisbacteria bacterium]|nr:helix-turn-helix domain-containing protein [Candidatus Margulisiibacteriota bacterium]MBU1021508.1 helix-turn-helix domain-containing protein [Candidatus Margulisiibacteriota bacterium]MBU1728593.1 helix-turn-helix domain-containing protein [Candidatus Margulisiibacteriota bacterium]MBU1955828.1 helix-turn-helix domain-containing protein [Candidatus Margulisiibacteriota bacterium]